MLDADLDELDRTEQLISAAVVIGEPDYFYDAAAMWLIRQDKADPRDSGNWAYRQMHTLLTGRGQLFWTHRAAEWCEAQRRRLRMKLLNVGQLLDDLSFAKSRVNRPRANDLDRDRLRAAKRRVHWNSVENPLGEAASTDASENGSAMALEVAETREIALDTPEGIELAKVAQNAGNRLVWRPGGRDVAVVHAN